MNKSNTGRRRCFGLALLLMLALILAIGVADAGRGRQVQAQADRVGDWWLWWYSSLSDELILFTPAGIQNTFQRPHLPNEAGMGAQLSLSPDGSVLLVAARLQSGNQALGFYSINQGRFLQIHEAAPGEDILLSQATYDAATGRVAIGLANPVAQSWRVIVFELAGGTWTHAIDHSAAGRLLGSNEALPVEVLARPVFFHENVVHFQLLPAAAPLPDEVTALAWSLNDGSVSEGRFKAGRLDVLPEGGQAVFACGNGIYVDVTIGAHCPIGDETLEHTPFLLEHEGRIVQPKWVAGGLLMLFEVRTEAGATIWRFFIGDAIGLIEPTPRQVLTLPNGFLSVSEENQLLFHHLDAPWEPVELFNLGAPQVQLLWTNRADVPVGLQQVAITPPSLRPEATLIEPPVVSVPLPGNPPTETLLPTEPPASTEIPVEVPVLYQAFERGFMLQGEVSNFGDTIQCAFVFSTTPTPDEPDGSILMPQSTNGYQYCTQYGSLPENPMTDGAPAGLLIPVAGFGRIWGAYESVRTALGYATAEAFTYMGVVPPSESSLGGGPFYTPIITLPDGRALYCGTRGATAGDCDVR